MDTPSKVAPRKAAPSKDLEDAHWYQAFGDGTVVDRFDATLRDALEDQRAGGPGLFPSPTTVLNIMARPELEAYKIKAALIGGLTVLHQRANALELTRREGEDDREFLRRGLASVIPPVDDEDHRRAAAKEGRRALETAQNFGVDVHSALESFLRDRTLPPAGTVARPHVERLADWFSDHVDRVIYSERRLVSRQHGYAGTSDLGLVLKSGALVVADTKTGNWRPPRAGAALAPLQKLSHPLQIASYRAAAAETLGPEWNQAGGVILHVCSNQVMPVVAQPFSKEELDLHHRAFLGLFDTWCLRHDYRPRPERMRAAPPSSEGPELSDRAETAAAALVAAASHSTLSMAHE